MMFTDPMLDYFFGGIILLLVVASIIGFALSRRAKSGASRSAVVNLNERIFAWWVMVVVVAVAMWVSDYAVILLFMLLSFLALREFVTLAPTRRGDHRSLFWVFFIILPMNYVLIGVEWYGLWSVFIPVYGFLFIPLRAALRGDPDRFLERTAKIQWGVMVAVYCISHAPALLVLRIPGYEHSNGLLLLFFLIVVQMSDVMQYVWGKTFGRTKVAPVISPSKTVEGFLGGILSASAIGAALSFATPFNVWEAAALSFLVALAGFCGGLVMSAVKRDIGVKDYGALLPGHGGILDRLDSVAYAAPIFFHVVRYYFTP